ncbi:hypothetical protein Tco_0631032, partial [Tanacetum coccineum]
MNQNPNQNQNLNQNLLNANMINDPLYIASSDHPGMVLTNTPINGSNFHGWSRNVRMALGAKLKLGFIDGSCVKPDVGDVELQRWIRCDYMVTCWILNSMVTELSDAFLYAQSASELWKEIAKRASKLVVGKKTKGFNWNDGKGFVLDIVSLSIYGVKQGRSVHSTMELLNTSSTDSQMHNNIMAAGSKDRPPMLGPGRYSQWRS